MNICFVSQEYPPDSGWGGMGTYVYNIARSLTRLGHQVCVISRAVRSEEQSRQCDGRLHVYRVWHRNYDFLKRPPLKWLGLERTFHHVIDRPFCWGYSAYNVFKRVSQEHPFQIIEAPEHNADGFIYALRRKFPGPECLKTKLVVKLHTPMLHHCWLNNETITADIRTLDRIERWTAAQADYITSPSRNLAQIVAHNWNLSLEQIRILRYPIDEEVFTPASDMNSNDVLYVGRLEIRKGVDILIDAFEQVLIQCPDATLTMVGAVDVHYKPALEERLRHFSKPSAIRLVGKIDREQLPHYYQNSQICVIPSRYDNFPNVCLEAMSCGKAIVASDCGGIGEMIKHEKHGMLAPVENPQALSQAIIRLLKNHELAEELGANARKSVETNYAGSIVAAQTADFYASLLKE